MWQLRRRHVAVVRMMPGLCRSVMVDWQEVAMVDVTA